MNGYGHVDSNGEKYPADSCYSEPYKYQSTTALQMNIEEQKKREQLNRQVRQKWESTALGLAIISVICLIVLGSCSFYVSSTTNSAAAYGFGFDCFLDVGTSLVVIWRFCGSNNSQSTKKEKIALFILGILFILASTSVASKSVKFLIDDEVLDTSAGLYILAGFATFFSMSLFIAKLYVANKLDSKSVRADGYSSLACGITAFTMIISSIAFTIDNSVYYLDDIVGLVLAVLLLLYGIKIICEATCLYSSSREDPQQTKLTSMEHQQKRGYETME
ncbi:transmembrane protein 163a-like [Antedon mediterranea]|uniref:transmembrane protein 163a-like n=1 Tax=Antedon mediterranea TaxID=105859 RepID=UPI003AF9892D